MKSACVGVLSINVLRMFTKQKEPC